VITLAKHLFAIDDTLIDQLEISREAVKCLCDYVPYSNQKILTSIDCWKRIEESNIPDEVKKLLRGSTRRETSTNDCISSIVNLLNFESQFKIILLITRRNYSTVGLKENVQVISFALAHKLIEEDEEFEEWRILLRELWKIQKFKGGATE